MKKVLLTGVALLLAGGTIAPAFAADPAPGFTVTGDARARYYYKSEEYSNAFGNTNKGLVNSQTNMDSRLRFDLTGTAAGGSYIKGRIRLMENVMGDFSQDVGQIQNFNQNNLWADKAYFGIPFTKEFTMEVGKYRSTYGPQAATNNFFYDDVNLTGAKGIVKLGNFEINPFFEYMTDSNNINTSGSTNLNNNQGFATSTNDQRRDHDVIRYGAHAKTKVNKDWTVGGMLGYQADARDEVAATLTTTGITKNEGTFGSIYTNGKADAFGLISEVSFTAANLNGFNNWRSDYNYVTTVVAPTASTPAVSDQIGSKNNGFGGYMFPNYQIDKLNLGLNLGFTSGGFLPDRAFGFVMLGTTDNSVISAQQIGLGGDWFWAGFVPSYQITDTLKLTGNMVYASVSSPWKDSLDGPGFVKGTNQTALSSAWEVSALLQYTISKGANVYFAGGYLNPSLQYVNQTSTAAALKNDAALGAYTRFELNF